MMCACVWFVRQWSVHTKRYHISTAFPYKDCIFVYVVGCWYSHQNQFAHTQNIYSDTIAISIDCRSKASEIQRISLFFSLDSMALTNNGLSYKKDSMNIYRYMQVNEYQHVHLHFSIGLDGQHWIQVKSKMPTCVIKIESDWHSQQ